MEREKKKSKVKERSSGPKSISHINTMYYFPRNMYKKIIALGYIIQKFMNSMKEKHILKFSIYKSLDKWTKVIKKNALHPKAVKEVLKVLRENNFQPRNSRPRK